MYKLILVAFVLFTNLQVVVSQVMTNDGWKSSDKNKSFTITFDNDTYYLTDYYYTQGLDFELILPIFNQSPLFNILPGNGQTPQEHSGISLAQRLYTPKNIRDTLIQFNDRPFAATLEICHSAWSLNHLSGAIFEAKIHLGIIGPAAGGEILQQKIHDWIDSPEANGWPYEIGNALILNYDLTVSYPLIYLPSFQLTATGRARVGTLFDDLGLGMGFGAGEGFYKSKALSESKEPTSDKKFKPFVNIDGFFKWTGYNATLQGGLFSTPNIYELSYHEITPWVFSISATAGIFWKNVGLSYTHNYLSKEFDAGSDHQYGSFRLFIYF